MERLSGDEGGVHGQPPRLFLAAEHGVDVSRYGRERQLIGRGGKLAWFLSGGRDPVSIGRARMERVGDVYLPAGAFKRGKRVIAAVESAREKQPAPGRVIQHPPGVHVDVLAAPDRVGPRGRALWPEQLPGKPDRVAADVVQGT